MYKIEDFEMMEPMKYYDNAEPTSVNLQKKRQDIIDNKDNLYIASTKHDGDWGMFIHYKRGENLIRSRSISVKTGKYGDMTEKLPHLAAEMDNWPDNTVVLAEICWGEYGTNANTVGTILRCLPAKAVERQKEKKLVGKVFDILMWDGEDLTASPYINRLEKIDEEFNIINQSDFCYFTATTVYFNDFALHADEIIAAGGEGLVIQLKSNPYMPGTRTAWKTLKMKQALPHMDLKVVGVIEPNKIYEGDCPDTWKYWEGDCQQQDEEENWYHYNFISTNGCPINGSSCLSAIPVTKPYAMGWKNGVIVDFNGVNVSVTSGLTDADREWLASNAAAEMIESGELFAEVKAMSVNDKLSLRHPALVRLRNDI